jgi:hypothetical protein
MQGDYGSQKPTAPVLVVCRPQDPRLNAPTDSLAAALPTLGRCRRYRSLETALGVLGLEDRAWLAYDRACIVSRRHQRV